tara:strand:- start:51165 stop:52037 length:873 start_codon:yes stop_codon:yes gene_type:complete
MINIIIPCTPNYENKRIINTVSKKIDIVSQFIILCNSIKKNWNFDYKINLFYNKKYSFSDNDLSRITKLDIDVYPITPDYKKTPYMVRCNALCENLKNKGTHRLLLDCDTIALSNPRFNLNCDWQAMFAGSVIDSAFYNRINTRYNYNLDLKNKIKGKLFQKYIEDVENKKKYKYKNFFPHFNAGAILLKEELCAHFKELVVPSYEISNDLALPENIRHIGVQYAASFALMKISNNWEPFEPGFNYLVKSYDADEFGKDKIQLLHYCGTGGYKVAYKYFKEQIDCLTKIL